MTFEGYRGATRLQKPPRARSPCSVRGAMRHRARTKPTERRIARRRHQASGYSVISLAADLAGWLSQVPRQPRGLPGYGASSTTWS